MLTTLIHVVNLFTVVSASSIHGGHRAAHSRLHLQHRQSATGFPLAATGSLSGYGLASACERVLYQTVSCDSYVASFVTPAYRASLGDDDFTALVCSPTCAKSLEITHTRILGVCASSPNLFSGYPVVSLVDSVRGGWKETCLRDAASGKWCNGQLHQIAVQFPTHYSIRHNRLIP
jgi:hypothetical protein